MNVFIIERSFKTKTNKQTKLHRDWLLTQSHFLEDFNLKILNPHTANAKAATRGVPQKNLVWKIMKNSQESLEPEHFFNVVADCRLATLLTRDSGISFSWDLRKFFRTPFLQNTSGQLIWHDKNGLYWFCCASIWLYFLQPKSLEITIFISFIIPTQEIKICSTAEFAEKLL